MTETEYQDLVNRVLSTLRTNSKEIENLPSVLQLSDTDSFEISKGRKVSFSTLLKHIKGYQSSEGTEDNSSNMDILQIWKELSNDSNLKLVAYDYMPDRVKSAIEWVEIIKSNDNDNAINKWNEIISFLSEVEATSLNEILKTYATKEQLESLAKSVGTINGDYIKSARKISAGTGLTGGGDLSVDRTLSLATIGKSGTYTKVIVDAYGRVTGSSTLLESDIPYLSIAKISNLQSTIDTINKKFAYYLPLSGGAMTSTKLVTNLNADLLDGVHLKDVHKSGWVHVTPYSHDTTVVKYYWFKVAQIDYAQDKAGKAVLELLAMGDNNYPYSNSAQLSIQNYCDIDDDGNLISHTSSIMLITDVHNEVHLKATIDRNGGVWVQADSCGIYSTLSWRAILEGESDYPNVQIHNGTTKQFDTPEGTIIHENEGVRYDVLNNTYISYPYNYQIGGSLTIGGANGVTLSWDTENQMLRISKGGYFLGPVSTKGVSNETGTGGTGVALSAVWDSMAHNTDAYGSTKIHQDHIPSLTKSKISDFPTLVSAFANDAGYITASAIINKADKATTIQGYGLWEKYSDLNDAPMGAFFCGGNSVANSPESGNYISGITLAKDKNAQYRTQLGFVNNRIFTRQENGANNWSQWRELAFLGDVAKKATTLAGYGITDAVPFINMVNASNLKSIGVGYVNANGANGENGGIISFGSASHQTQIHSDYSGGNIHWRVNSNGTLTNWKNLLDANNYSNYAVTLNTNQTISGVKTLSANLLSATSGTLDIGDGYNSFNRIFVWHYKSNSLTKSILSSGKWYRIWNFSQGVAGTHQKNAIISINKAYNYEQGQTITLAVSINNWGQTYVINQLSGTTGLISKVRVTGKRDYSYVDVYISSAENAESYSVSGYGNGERVDFEELADDATNDSTRTEELTVVNGTAVNYPLSLQNATPLVVNSTTMVANLNANYLGGLNKDSFQKAVYDYVNVVGTANDTALPTVLAPSIYNGTNSIGGNFKYYDTKFYNGRSNTSNRCQLAYGYDVDSIHFRRYKDGTWYDWKKVVFTEGEDNIQVTNAYARFTANNGSLSGFFGFSGNVIGAYSTSLAEWLISASTSAICIAPQGKVNVGVKTWTPAYDFHVNGSIGANSLTIGQATISWDSTNQMLKVNTGAYFLGPVSTKGVSNGSGLVAVAQFGVTWQDSWYIEGGTTINAYGTTTKSISEGQGSVNGSEISITCNAFAGKKVGDIEIFTLGWDGEPSADARLVPFAIYGSTLICTLRLNGTMIPTNFKIKIY